MSKVKKAISLLLTVMLVASVCPVNAFGVTSYSNNNNGEYTTRETTVTPPIDFWVTTEGTTEIVRIAKGTSGIDACQYGTAVVSATPSGVAATTGFTGLAYGGETPSWPKVVMTLHGVSDKNLFSNVSLIADGMSITAGATTPTITSDAAANTLTYTWTITGGTVSGGAGTPIIYSCVFTYNNVPYTEYAYAHAENVFRPGGISLFAERAAGSSKRDIYASTMAVFQSANAKASFAGARGSWPYGYLNYTSTAMTEGDTKALIGMDPDWRNRGADELGVLMKDNTDGTIVYYYHSGNKDADNYTHPPFSTANDDGNRSVTTVWVDKGFDHLGTGSYTSGGKTLTNGLNLRHIFKEGVYTNFYFWFLQRYNIESAATNHSADPQLDGMSNGFSVVKTNTDGQVALKANIAGRVQYQVNTDGTITSDKAGIFNAGEHNDGKSGYLMDYAVSPSMERGDGVVRWNDYLMINYEGVGPTTTQATATSGWAVAWTGVSEKPDTEGCDNPNKDRPIEEGATADTTIGVANRQTDEAVVSLQFRVYDTTALRELIRKVDEGTGVIDEEGIIKNSNGKVFNKGKNPQEWMYTYGWDAFSAAYDAAYDCIVAFDVNTASNAAAGTEQNKIDAAYNLLAKTYSELDDANPADSTVVTDYQQSGAVVIRHCVVDPVEGEVEIIPAQGIQNVKSGSKIVLMNASTIKGYKPLTPTSINGSVIYTKSTATIRDAEWNTVSMGQTTVNGAPAPVYTFYYEPDDQNLIITPNNGYGVTNDNPTPTVYPTLVKLDAAPDFAAIKAEISGIKDAWNFKKGYTLEGLYTDSAFTNKVNESTYKMGIPAAGSTEIRMYAKWVPKPVDLKVVKIDGVTMAEIPSPAIVESKTPALKNASAPANDNLADVSFSRPATPPSAGDIDFIEYYSDAACTKAVTWPVVGSYADGAAYGISENADGNNYVTIYAKYSNMVNKIFFEPQGGTMPDGVGEYMNYTANTPFTNPIPTREGYTFAGWTLEDGTTLIASGTASTITLPDSNGRIVYAQWEPNDVTITFKLNIPSSEQNVFNSKNAEGKNYYYQITVKADQPVDESDFPPDPRRYANTFNYWKRADNLRRFDKSGNYPTTDLELTAEWRNTDTTAFADIISVEKISGEEFIVDEQHGKTRTAAPGDTVSMKFYARGNFFAGSSSFIFFYDGDFFESFDSIELVQLNRANSYIDGIAAVKYDEGAYKDSAALRAYLESHDQPISNVIPGTEETVSNLKMFQVAIDPDLNKIENFTSASLDSGEYVFEIRMKIKDDAEGTGSLWLATELLRTAETPWGDVFFAYSDSAADLMSLKTNVVNFDTDAVVTTIDIDETLDNGETTITVMLPTENGQPLGQFNYLSGSSKTYTGLTASEILEVYNESYDEANDLYIKEYGFPGAEREGYTLDGWYKVNTGASGYDAANSVNFYDLSDEWAAGYYGTEDQDGNTYQAKWTPIPYTFTFYENAELSSVRGTYTYDYDSVISAANAPEDMRSGATTDFLGWIPVGMEANAENAVSVANGKWIGYQVKGDMEFYPWTRSAQKTVIINPVYGETGIGTAAKIQLTTEVQAALGIELRVGDTVKVVESIPATPEDGVQYVLASDVNALAKGTFDKNGVKPAAGLTNPGNYTIDLTALPTQFTVVGSNNAADNTFNVAFTGDIVTVTFEAYGYEGEEGFVPALASDYTGSYTVSTRTIENPVDPESDDVEVYSWTISGKLDDTYDFAAATAGVAAPFGYKLNRWTPTSNQGTYRTATYTAEYVPVTVNIHYLNEDFTPNTAITTNLTATYDAAGRIYNIPSKTGYKGGWLPVKPNAAGTGYDAVGALVTNRNYTPSANNDWLVVTTNAETGEKTFDVYFAESFTANNYNVYYYIDGTQDTSLNQSVAYDSTYTLPYGAVREGYDFVGWYTTTNYTGDKYAEGSTPKMQSTSTVKYYGHYVLLSATATFNVNGGTWADLTTEPKEFTDTVGTAIVAPAYPIKTGYNCIGWAKSAAATEALSGLGNLSASGDSFYAVWQKEKYTIGFDANGGNAVTALTNVEYESVQTLPVPVRTGYTFAGWTYNGSPVDYNAETMAYTVPDLGDNGVSVEFAATWTVNQYTYKFYDGDTELTDLEIKQDYGTAVTAPTYTKTGYKSNGWTPEVVTPMAAENKTYQAVLVKEKYTISFNTDGGNTVSAIENAEFESVQTLPVPVKTGYDFLGWTYNDAPVDYDAETMAYTVPDLGNDGAEVEFKATWTESKFELSFDSNGGSTVASQEVYFNAKATKPANPTKEGYTFSGWKYNDAAVNWNTFTMPAENVTMVADWTVNQYTYKFYDGDTELTDLEITQDYGTEITVPSYTKTGYEFKGWDPEVPGTMGSVSQSFNAKLEKEKYNISFNPNGGEAVTALENVEFGSVQTLPTPVWAGHTFTGWTYGDNPVGYDDNGEVKYEVPDLGNNGAAVTFKATWQINSYMVTFWESKADITTEGAIPFGSKQITYNEYVESISNVPSKDGYDFDKWVYASDDTAVAFEEDRMPDENINVYAAYTQHIYTLKYNFNDDATQPATKQVTAGDVETLKVFGTDFTRTGWEFTGWYLDEGLTAKIDSTTYTIPAQENNGTVINLYAGWNHTKYQLTFDYNDGVTEAVTADKYYGDAITEPEEPSNDGYEFLGWYIGTEKADFTNLTMPADNLTIKAEWEINPYTVTFVYNNGDEDYDVTQNFGTEVAQPEDPVKEGNTFAGWTLDGEAVTWPYVMPDYDAEIEANWTPEKYSIKFDTKFEDVETPDSLENKEFESIVELPEITKDGYIFEGWEYNATIHAPGEYLVEDLGEDGGEATFEAVWTANEYKIIINPNGGTWSDGTTTAKVIKQLCGTAISKPADPTREGYVFAGYDVEIPGTMGVTPKEGIIYTAQWEAHVIPVKFYFDVEKTVISGSSISKSTISDIIATGAQVMLDTVSYGSTYTIPEYAYGDEIVDTWFDANGTVYEAGDEITIEQLTAIKLAASASELSTDVKKIATFDPNGGIWSDESTAAKTEEVVVGAKITAPDAPTMAGYEFKGWAPELDIMPGEDTTFTATWEIVPYSVSFYLGTDDTNPEVFDNIYYGEEIEFPAEPEKDGYEFTGWYYASLVEGAIVDSETACSYGATMPESDVYIIAHWVATVRTVTFYAYGDADPLTGSYTEISGEGITNPVEVQAGAAFNAIGAIAAPEYANFTFAGWFDSEGVQWVEGTAVNDNIALYAHYNRVAVKLVPVSETSTAMIERDGVVETYNTFETGAKTPYGVTSIIAPNAETYEATGFESWYVYGLSTNLKVSDLANYVKVSGDGSYKAYNTAGEELADTAALGTSVVIKVTDNVTNAVVEEFYIVIFGDINGDGYVLNTDLARLKAEVGSGAWSVESKINYLVKAADINLDGYVLNTDTSKLISVTKGDIAIDQLTGLAG